MNLAIFSANSVLTLYSLSHSSKFAGGNGIPPGGTPPGGTPPGGTPPGGTMVPALAGAAAAPPIIL